MQGVIDYRLAKRAVLEGFRRGSLDRMDICDAHPQLMRAAHNIGIKTEGTCPVCAHQSLRQVKYVYGDELKHLSGRPVYPEGWELSLSREFGEFRCYTIEVCVDCAWNHLAACQLMGRRFKPAGPKAAGQRSRRTSS
ncbi:MAG: DUF5318 family protein [Actinomycetota bacterium]